MAKRILYSFRADRELITALRDRATENKTTVTELIHSLLYEGLNQRTHKNNEGDTFEAVLRCESLKSDIDDRDFNLIVHSIRDEISSELPALVRKHVERYFADKSNSSKFPGSN